MVSRDDIAAGLGALGLGIGDNVLVHSSLSSFGKMDGGADAVVDAILDVIGAQGTLVVPTYNYTPGVFDPVNTPSVCGAITEAARKRPNALRSHHPTHSVAAIGALGDVITEGHEKTHAFARGSALFKLLQANGKILLLGIDHTKSSIIHVAEEMVKLPYLDRSHLIDVLTSRGKVTRKWIRRPGCSNGFNVIEEPLQENDAIKETFIGDCRARLMSARAVVNAAVELLKFDNEALLCDLPDCMACAEARAMITAFEVEEQDKQMIAFAADEDKTLRLIEDRFNIGEVDLFTTDDDKPSSN
ncbi:MAG: AAC(3) family N-acetyltransferase [Armatimonadetes bacterium]|nr:AAC(3) family N-acetyltransferase [Armatimonadota bacterium]